MPIAQSRIWSRPTAMKCSSGEYIHPYEASSAYHSASLVQSWLRSASRFASSQDSQNSWISARDRSDIGILLDRQRERRAVLHGGGHISSARLVGVLVQEHDDVVRLVEPEDV